MMRDVGCGAPLEAEPRHALLHRARTSHLLRVMAVAALCACGTAPMAATVDVLGSAGADGANGANGSPGGAGGAGQAGATVDEFFNPDGETIHDLSLTGGAGGAGGAGGTGLAGSSGGNGGAGGNGGDAIGQSELSGRVNFIAAGGSGGTGGRPGDGTIVGRDGDGGRGGDASVDMVNSPLAGDAENVATVTGGGGGQTSIVGNGGDGGAASLLATAHTLSDDQSALVSANVTGGRGGFVIHDQFGFLGSHGGTGGAATVEGSAIVDGNREARVDLTATGGQGGSINGGASRGDEISGSGNGGDGGSARIEGLAENQGAESARVAMSATGGNGGDAFGIGMRGGNGGIADTFARASSAMGGTVSVEARDTGGAGGRAFNGAHGGNGADALMNDQVLGSTAGVLFLTQVARAGSGGWAWGFGIPGNGGNSESHLHVLDREASALYGQLGAGGGAGGDVANGVSHDGGKGGDALASMILIGSDKVDGTVSAYAGDGGKSSGASHGGMGGAARLGEVFGQSTGGGRVSLTGVVHGGRGGSAYTGGAAADGASVELIDVLDGETTGHLSLSQYAEGGWGGDANTTSLLNAPASSGRGGDATNSLTRHEANAVLTLTTNARAGGGGDSIGVGRAGDGGSAVAISSATNDIGSAQANSTSFAGFGGGVFFAASGAIQGRGGNALSRATAITNGGAAARAEGNADAGGGAHQSGSATVDTTAVSVGRGAAQAGGIAPGFEGVDALPRVVQAVAEVDDAGQASALATSIGRGGTLTTLASRFAHGAVVTADASAQADMAGSSSVRAVATSDDLPRSNTGFLIPHADARAVALPQADAVNSLLSANPEVADALVVADANTILGYGLLNIYRVKDVDDEALTYRAGASFTFDLAALSASSALQVGFLDPTIIEGSFDTLHLKVSIDNHTVLDELFESADQALSFFDDHAFAFDPLALNSGGDAILTPTVILDLQSSHSVPGWDGVSVDFIVASTTPVPLPSPLALLGFSAAYLLFGRRRGCIPGTELRVHRCEA